MVTANHHAVTLEIEHLTDEQVIAWYDKHPSATVRSLVRRLKQTRDDMQRACLAAYEEGVRTATPIRKRRPPKDVSDEQRGYY